MELRDGWEVAASSPGRHQAPEELSAAAWRPAAVPGTAAGAVGDPGRDYDAEDWWFRCRFALPDDWLGVPVALVLEGVATVCEVFLNGVRVAGGESMWAQIRADLGDHLRAENELVIACRALGPLLGHRRRPSARWRTRVVNAGNLRWYRTMVFGRSPGFAPGPAPVGPWRPVRLVREDEPGLESLAVRSWCSPTDAGLTVRARTTGAGPVTAELAGGAPVALRDSGDGWREGTLPAGRLARWWPHTHGTPALHDLSVSVGARPVAARRVGFRTLGHPEDVYRDGLALSVNGVPTFVRGAVWTPPDLFTMSPGRERVRDLLTQVRDAGMNMLRVVGTGAYESSAFYDLCDELGILVWQDLMFANLDYPVSEPEFAATVLAEAREALTPLVGRPCLAVVCGNSEVEQQPAMLGLDPGLGRHPLWEQRVPELLDALGSDCAYLRSTPSGGALPFHPDGAATHYFGVSGYFMPVSDLRRADLRFASECLAFANVPDTVEHPVHHPDWKRGVQRDAGTGWGIGAGWDFDDVRDHYLAALYKVDPVQLRRFDHERYLTLSRAASAEIMSEAMGEWRRDRSRCRGALVLWLKDMLPGAGLGVIDHSGTPKVPYHYLRRILAPVAVWMTDEGLAGISVHIANDRDRPLTGRLRVALYRNGQTLVAEAAQPLELGPHAAAEHNLEAILGYSLDPAWAYRFGPPAADVIVAALHAGEIDSGTPGALAVRFPAGAPLTVEPPARLGLSVRGCLADPDRPTVLLRSERVVHCVRISVTGFAADDDAFSLEPGRARTVRLRRAGGDAAPSGGSVTALNLAGRADIAWAEA